MPRTSFAPCSWEVSASAAEAMDDPSHPLWDRYDAMAREMQAQNHPVYDQEAPLEGRMMLEDEHPRVS